MLPEQAELRYEKDSPRARPLSPIACRRAMAGASPHFLPFFFLAFPPPPPAPPATPPCPPCCCCADEDGAGVLLLSSSAASPAGTSPPVSGNPAMRAATRPSAATSRPTSAALVVRYRRFTPETGSYARSTRAARGGWSGEAVVVVGWGCGGSEAADFFGLRGDTGRSL